MFGLGKTNDKSAAELLRQSMARLRARNQEQLAILLHHFQELQRNVTAAGGMIGADEVAEDELFDFWQEDEQDEGAVGPLAAGGELDDDGDELGDDGNSFDDDGDDFENDDDDFDF
jgi:hypothetical protein